MTHKLVHGTVVDSARKVIHAVRVLDEILDYREIDDIAEKMRARVLSRYGEQAASVVVIQGDTKETLRLFGESYAVERVRTAMFNAALSFSPIELE
jgi:hypothetical protein